MGPNSSSFYRLNDNKTKAKLLVALSQAFGDHSVPNSLLHTLPTLDEVFLFYNTKVDVRTPYEKLNSEKVGYPRAK